MNRVNDKIKELEKYLDELREIIPLNYEEYKNNYEKKAACERYFEKIVEAIIDLGHLFIKAKRYALPTEDIKVFDILLEKDILDKELCERLKDAKGMRNILSHEYGKVDDELVYESITLEIINDAFSFLKKIEKELN